MKDVKKLYNIITNQKGITLFELLIVIFITGILAVAISRLYRMALNTYNKTMYQSNITLNVTNFLNDISADIHVAEKVTAASNDTITISSKDEIIQYLIIENDNDDGIQIIRKTAAKNEEQNYDWEMNPKFTVAEFYVNDLTFLFEQNSTTFLNISIENENYKFKTAFGIRSYTKTDSNISICDTLPAFPDGQGSYFGGDLITHKGNIYKCMPWPKSGWANSTNPAYEPGAGWAWKDAWIFIDHCNYSYNELYQYPEGRGSYVGGDKVINYGYIYECKTWPEIGWANSTTPAYEPGVGWAWKDAWIYIGACDDD